MRRSEITRKTNETNIKLELDLDGSGKCAVDTGIGFFDHMLQLFAAHGRFDLNITCKGDIHVDGHHSVEDIGICLGTAFADALGDAAGITRFADVTLPMDEALVMCAVDVCGRSHLTFDVTLPSKALGEMDAELFEEFMQAFVRKAGIVVHIRSYSGKNAHHILEACFKSLARTLRAAVKIDPSLGSEVPSTKGNLYE